MNLLDVFVTETESGPVVALSGEADLTTLGQLKGALDAQIRGGARLVTVDLSRLRFADSASITALGQAARALRSHGGDLELLNPQPAITRVLKLTGVDQSLTVREAPQRDR